MGAAEDGLDAGDEVAHGEGFGDVVVGAEAEAGDHVVVGVAGGEEDDGDVGGLRVGFEAPGHLESVEVVHHDVEEDEVVGGDAPREGAEGVGRGVDAVAFEGEVVADAFADGFFVVDDEYSRRGVLHVFSVLGGAGGHCLARYMPLKTSRKMRQMMPTMMM